MPAYPQETIAAEPQPLGMTPQAVVDASPFTETQLWFLGFSGLVVYGFLEMVKRSALAGKRATKKRAVAEQLTAAEFEQKLLAEGGEITDSHRTVMKALQREAEAAIGAYGESFFGWYMVACLGVGIAGGIVSLATSNSTMAGAVGFVAGFSGGALSKVFHAAFGRRVSRLLDRWFGKGDDDDKGDGPKDRSRSRSVYATKTIGG